jgi:hypothetical protein
MSEMMEKSKKSRHAIEAWLSRHNIEPIIKEFLYPADTVDKLMKTKRGRPPKAPEPEPEKPGAKAKPAKSKK